VKSASPGAVSAVGQTVTYTFSVTNTGQIPVSDVTVNDHFTAPSAADKLVSPIVCGASSVATDPAGTLAIGATEMCSATYLVTQADLTAGSINNSATATGTPPAGGPVSSPPSTATVPVSGITVVKSTSTTEVTAVGQTITYSFKVTNTGTTSLAKVSVTDYVGASASGVTLPAPTCPQTALAAGVSEVCTSVYVTTQADVTAGAVTDTAVANATPPGGCPAGTATTAATTGHPDYVLDADVTLHACPPATPLTSTPSTVKVPVSLPPAPAAIPDSPITPLALTGPPNWRGMLTFGGLLVLAGSLLVGSSRRRRTKRARSSLRAGR
jgi:uncharacterized repeat protein (TIGR01451 family)